MREKYFLISEKKKTYYRFVFIDLINKPLRRHILHRQVSDCFRIQEDVTVKLIQYLVKINAVCLIGNHPLNLLGFR